MPQKGFKKALRPSVVQTRNYKNHLLIQNLIVLISTLALRKMPSTRPYPSNRPNLKMTAENVRTGIIVSVVAGVVAIVLLAYVVLKRRMNRGVKIGTRINSRCNVRDAGNGKIDGDLEVGVIREPLPVYRQEPGAG
jgi:Mg2+/citrate symporter